MSKIKQTFSDSDARQIDLSTWLNHLQKKYHLADSQLLTQACKIAESLTPGFTTFYGKPCLILSLEIAEMVLSLGLDQEAAAAGLISCVISSCHPKPETIYLELNESLVKIIKAVQQMDQFAALQQDRHHPQLEKIRKLLLAVATDIRVVIIKLAERLCFMHGIKSIPAIEQQRYAKEILDIYAPLANRLSLGQLKSELEDLAFRYLHPETYKMIADFLVESRVERELRIKELSDFLQEKVKKAGLQATVAGRAKHIYSIYLKAQRKNIDYQQVYDSHAVRILVSTVADCYAALSLVHSLWPPIMQEFDDYIAHPKPNGYRSIHTAVIDEMGRHFEIQIRTHAMHAEAEHGAAAHWLYKENRTQAEKDQTKINYLRQLLDWHQEIFHQEQHTPHSLHAHTLRSNPRIYVLTPAGDIIDLPKDATPLDFAYHLHSEIGHRCRGAKVNGRIVPLTYHLQTGEKIEIMTALHGGPSRDWLNPALHYIKTARARQKIMSWFKQQQLKEVAENPKVIAKPAPLKNTQDLLVKPSKSLKSQHHNRSTIQGADDLLTRFAKCCKPIPNDEIIGYITQGRGISIHKNTCQHIQQVDNQDRLLKLNWQEKENGVYHTDLKVVAYYHDNILNDFTALFTQQRNEIIVLLRLQSSLDKNRTKIYITLTIQIKNRSQLQTILSAIKQMPCVIDVNRV